jgi:glyoxylase-like metal-dependent hydrolase (beta-lactamase superfamily II)
MSTPFTLHTFTLGPLGTQSYVVACQDQAVLVDAPPGAAATVLPWLQAQGLGLQALLLTHGHWDHIADAAAIQAATQAPVHGHREDAMFFANPSLMMSRSTYGITVPAVSIDVWVAHGQVLQLLASPWTVYHVPGHCPGNVMYVHAATQAAFVGDVIFREGIGRYDFPGCSLEVLRRSIHQHIYTLPPTTQLYPGHGPHTTVAHEQAHNPYCPAQPLA